MARDKTKGGESVPRDSLVIRGMVITFIITVFVISIAQATAMALTI